MSLRSDAQQPLAAGWPMTSDFYELQSSAVAVFEELHGAINVTVTLL